MLTFVPLRRIFLVAGPTDMRKGFNGLCAIVREELGRDFVDTGEIFVFCNRLRNRLKILYWDRGGLWVCAKRLEKGTFRWPKVGDKYIEMTPEELAMLLGGIDIERAKLRRWYKPEESLKKM